MRKLKLFSMIGIAILSAFIFVGCSCKKEILPIGLLVTPTAQTVAVGDSYAVSYNITPINTTNPVVKITSDNTQVATVNTGSITAINGSVTITAVAAGTAHVSFKLDGTDIPAFTHTVTVVSPIVLETPENLYYNDLTQNIVFTSVANATFYQLKINDNYYTVSDPNKTNTTPHDVVFKAFGNEGVLSTGTEYSIKVRAIGDGVYYAHGTYGTYDQNPLVVYKFSPVANVTTVNGLVSWDHNELYEQDYVSYVVSVDDVEFAPQTENTFNLNITTAKDYAVKIKVINTDDQLTTVYDSEYTSTHTITKLSTPNGLLLNNGVITNGLYTSSVFSWNNVTGAYGYEVAISPQLLNETTTLTFNPADTRQILIDDRFEDGTTYTFTIKALGNDANVVYSNNATFTFTKLPQVESVGLNNNVLTFTPADVFATVNYEIILQQNSIVETYVSNGGTVNLTEYITASGDYTISIRSLAVNDLIGGNYYANSQVLATGITATKLQSPSVLRVHNDGEMYWSVVSGASSYDVYYDDGLIANVTSLQLDGLLEGIYDLLSSVTITEGEHSVAVVAIGTGNNISSSEDNKLNYSFTKLGQVQAVTVLSDVISWEIVEDAYLYFVSANTNPYSSNGSNTSYTISNPVSENEFKIIAVGNNTNIISGDVALFNVNKLLTPSGVSVNNGVLYFNYDANNFYKLFVNGTDIGVQITNGTYNFNTNLSVGLDSTVGLKAYPLITITDNTYLSSDIVTFTLNKLATPTNLAVTKITATENYELTWDAVTNASAYKIVIAPHAGIDVTGLDLDIVQAGTTYTIPSNWPKGDYDITVQAIGNTLSGLETSGTGYITSAISAIYTATKLPAPQQAQVVNNLVSWNVVSGAVEYELVVTYQGVPANYTTTNTTFNIVGDGGDYEVTVRAIGPTAKTMTSAYSVSNIITKLDQVSNLRISNGILTWDAYGQGITVVYDLYLTQNGSTRELLLQNYSGTSYVITLPIEKGVEHIFEVVVKSTGFISSNLSDPYTFEKLDNVPNFTITSELFTWQELTNASAYEIYNTTGGGHVLYATVPSGTNTYEFNENDALNAGTYTFTIRALGGENGNGNFINSDYSPTFTTTILSKVNTIWVQDGLVKWNLSYTNGDENNTPVSYTLNVYPVLNPQGDLDTPYTFVSLSNVLTEYSLASLPSGSYMVEIVSVGNGSTKITNASNMFAVEKLDASTLLNLRVSNGVVIWDEYTAGTNVTYEVFIDNVSVATISATTYVPNNLVVLQEYSIKLLVHANNVISSTFTNPITVAKLPQVTGFSINKNVTESYFGWNAVLSGPTEIASGYLITPTTTIPTFDGGAAMGETQKIFTLTVAGTYNFTIRAIGSTGNSGTLYLTGDTGNLVMVVVLDSVQNVEVVNNALHYQASDMYLTTDTTPDNFLIELYTLDGFGEEQLYTTYTTTNYSWDLKVTGTLLPAGSYIVYIYSVGTQNYKVTSAYAQLGYTLEILQTPDNFEIVEGVVNFDELIVGTHDINYEIYIDGVYLTTLDDTTLTERETVNTLITTPNTNYDLKIRAVSLHAITSEFSSDLAVNKLQTVTGMYIAVLNNVSKIYWTNVANASSYRLIISPIVPELSDLDFYNSQYGYFELAISGSAGFNVPTTLTPGTYTYTLVAVGNTTTAVITQGYLNSNVSEQNSFNLMPAPTGLRLEGGIIKWNTTPNAIKYQLVFYDTTDVQIDTVPFKTVIITALQYDPNTLEFVSDTYTLRIFALGNGIDNISSTTYEEMVFTKGDTLANYKINNGYLSWTVSQDLIKLYATGSTSGTLSGTDLLLIEDIFNGTTTDISPLLINNLYPLFNIEFTVNTAKVYATPTQVTQVGNDFVMFYDLNKPAGEYIVSARGMGNNSENIVLEGTTISLLDETAQVYNYIYTTKTSSITAYKLPAPVTPLPNSTTSIEGNILRWNSVEGTYDYAIIATSVSGSGPTIIDYYTAGVGVTDIEYAILDITQEFGTQKIPSGFAYQVRVIAMGTPDSTLNGGTNYLTSTYANISDIEILSEPQQPSVLNGVIYFGYNAKAEYQILHIYNNGTSYEDAIHDPNTNRIKREIIVSSATVESDNYLSLSNGYYFYDLENNPLFPETVGSAFYKMSVVAIGNGITTITSTENAISNVGKWPTVTLGGTYDIDIENGAFKWTHVSLFNGITTVYPTQYKVVITRTSSLEDDVVTSEIYSVGATTAPYIYYELPDTDDYPSYVMDEGTAVYYQYYITVSAMGLESAQLGATAYVTSDSVTSKTGERLAAPTSLRTQNGIVNWIAVALASGYDIYLTDESVSEEDLIVLDNVVQFTIDETYDAGTYIIMVRATSNTSIYLNSRKSSEITVIKLTVPNLRIVDGEVKWNNTDLSYANTIATLLEITGPVGFEGADLQGFIETDFSLNGSTYTTLLPYNHVANSSTGLNLKGTMAGEYTIGVTFIGSTGSILINDQPVYLATSNKIEFTFTKIDTPVIQLGSEQNPDIVNYVEWDDDVNATNYYVNVYKMDEENQVIKQARFTLKDDATYFTYDAFEGTRRFDLIAITEYDALPSEIKFGDNYFIYIEALGDNSVATEEQARFTLSNDSNILSVEIPIQPTDLHLDDYGTITWTTYSSFTNLVLELSYMSGGSYTAPEEIELPAGTESYKLSVISENYRIRIKSINGTLLNIVAQSAYTDIVQGAFNLYASGSGTALDPYLISNAMQLFNINYYTSSYFKLTTDISTSAYSELGEWKPIGEASALYHITTSNFSGQLDGDGYSINTITYSNTNKTAVAFIHTITAEGVVKNLHININGSNINVSSFGGVAVYNYGTIQNVLITGSIHLLQTRTFVNVGGVVAYNYSGANINNVVNQAVITGNTNNSTNTVAVGGIAYQNDGTVEYVGNQGNLTGSQIGGVIYINSGIVRYAYNKGSITSVTQDGYLQTIAVGGIIAKNNAGGKLTFSYALQNANMSVTNYSNSTQAYVGGLIGMNGSSQTITNSYVVYVPVSTAGVATTYGAIAGNSNPYLSIYDRVYFQYTAQTLYDIGNVSDVVGIESRTQAEMVQASFVTLLENNFTYVSSNYPKLTWEASFESYWS